ncbi:Type 1 glutamine amidotransferase-like domain-containing protein [Candidatus Saccharibacteria bacterium]|nr:Type 1 glutamine amidotransferase-like domain-containing protein [Candidatus Saccharibacteria bacterium]
MATRIILHGGNSNIKSDKNDDFYQEIIRGVEKDNLSVLCVYFARPEARWEDSYAEDQSVFHALGIETGRDLDTTMATYDMDELLGSIVEADVIFISGGYNGHLKDTLLTIGVKNFRQMIQGKTLVGISAGANILGVYYYSQGSEEIREGIGLLNIKVLTHYSEDQTKQLALLKSYKEDIPTVTVAEEEYVVIQ